jgi:beta-xylosidase
VANTQTIAQLPYDLADPDSLKRFLRELVDNLDGVLGYKGDNKYVQESDFEEQGLSVNELTTQTKTNTDTLDGIKKSLSDQSDEILDIQDQISVLNTTVTTATLDTVYNDFNNAAWATLQGRAEFQALGSDLANPPMSLVGTDTYTVYVDSTKTNASVWQYVGLDNGTLTVFMRIGTVSSWVKLSN